MKGLAELTKTTLVGGLLVVLPIYLSVLLLAKTLSAIFALLSPVTAAIPAGVQFRQVIAVLIVLAVCFVAGIVVRTSPGCAPRMRSSAPCSRRFQAMPSCAVSPTASPTTRARARSGRRWWR